MGTKVLGTVLICLMITIYSTNALEIQKGNGDTYKLVGVSKPRVPIGDNAIVRSGTIVEISCPADLSEQGARLLNWEINGNQLTFDNFNTVGYPNIRRYTENTITIYNISSDAAAIYTCVLVNAQTGEELDRADSNLQIAPDCPEGCEGMKGAKGYMGGRGPEGSIGRAGVPGVCYPEECPKPQQGEKGDPGASGPDGTPGADGAKGQKGGEGGQGETGITGDQGQKGMGGDKGEKGNTGGQGQRGIKGLKGTDGDEGVRGGRGDKGMEGEKGNTGPTGQGSNGGSGDKGFRGATGNNGEQGQKGDSGTKGGVGERGVKGNKGGEGTEGGIGPNGRVGQNLIIVALNSTFNSDCSAYEQGQIVYDSVIDRFVYCDGTSFQCIRDKPCFEECDVNQVPLLTETLPELSLCVNLIYVVDESASMRPEHIWLREVSAQIPIVLEQTNFEFSDICSNYFGVLRFGADRSVGVDHVGRPLDLGGIEYKGQTLAYWGNSSDLVNELERSSDAFIGAGRIEDGYAAMYRALQLYEYIQPACRKMLLITDEDRDNITPTPDPPAERIPTLFNENMIQTLDRSSIQVSAVVNLTISVDPSYNINSDNIFAILPGNKIVHRAAGLPGFATMQITGDITLGIPDGTDVTQNTQDTYYEMVRMTGGVLWSLPVSRAQREIFTAAFLFHEIVPNVPIPNRPTEDGCMVTGCRNCSCIDGDYICNDFEVLDFDTTIQCRPTECNSTQIISGFRQPSCVDMVFAVAETRQMEDAHQNVKDVAGRLIQNLAVLNFGQENSLCQNQYCLMAFGQSNGRVSDSCYAQTFETQNGMRCGISQEIGGLILGFDFEASGQGSDGYPAIYTTIQNYSRDFQGQSCRHVTLITNGPRSSCGSFQNGDLAVPSLNSNSIRALLAENKIILNAIVAAQFEDGDGNEALGIYKDTDGTVKALVVNANAPAGYEERDGGRVKANTASFNIDPDYIMVALNSGGSAWNIETMRTQTDSFTKAFVSAVVVRSSLSCGQTAACVECRCEAGVLLPCVESSRCIVPEPPILQWISGNVTIVTDGDRVLVGGYGENELEVYYGLDGDKVNTFTIYSALRQGSMPVNVTWYFITASGERVLIENSAVASYVSVSQSNEYDLEFSQVGDFIEGTYLIVAENEHGMDRQLTHIGILPKWDKTSIGTLTGSQGMLGQTVVGRYGSDIRITGIVREGTKPWSFGWYYNGNKLVEGTDYSFEYSGNQAIITIHNYEATDIGEYTAIVSNRFGQDTHTFNLLAETVVSCNNNPNSLTTNCINCQSNAQTKQSTLTVYAHSFPPNLKLTWFRVNKISGQRQQISENTVVLGANSIEVSVSSLCEYLHEVVVTGQNTYTFNCPCTDCPASDGENTVTLSCCGGNQTLLRASDCGDDFYADILLLIDVSASMQTEHAFLREFLPRFERSLQENCVGNSLINKNQYTAVAFGSLQENSKELPYFVGPNLNRGDSTQNVYFTIDVDNPINVTNTIDQLPTIGEREDGYAATRFAVEYAQLRDDSIKFAILVTDEGRELFYGSTQEALDNTLIDPNNLSDFGRSFYTQFLLNNSIIPIQIIDIALNAGTTQCLGVSSAETCFYRDPNSNVIENIEFAEVVNTAESRLLQNVHEYYLQPALNARGYAWDLKVIRENETGNWDAITTALTNEVLLRAREELTQCRNCRCLPGGVQCQIVPLDQQAICKCEKSFPNNQPYCTCITEDEARPDICRCRHINGLSAATCQETGIITLVKT